MGFKKKLQLVRAVRVVFSINVERSQERYADDNNANFNWKIG
jgi:hypothetical protein